MGGDAAAIFDARVNQSDHSPIAILRAHKLSGPDEAFVAVLPLPEKGFYVGRWLWRDTQANSPETIQRFFRHILIEALEGVIGRDPDICCSVRRHDQAGPNDTALAGRSIAKACPSSSNTVGSGNNIPRSPSILFMPVVLLER
jgi:hypothetical protein